MGGRRSNTEGSIFQDKDGIWWAQLPPDAQGRRPKRRARTQREALEKLRALRGDRERGIDLSVKQPTVAQFLTTWLEQSVKPAVKPKTHESYAQIVRLYLVPHLGSIRLDKLTAAQVQHALNDLLREGLAPRTVQYTRAVLRKALDLAVKWTYIPRNVATLVESPRVPKHPIEPLSVAQAHALLDAAAGHRLAALYHVALLLGLRQGELLGLRWSDIDWSKQTLSISGQVQTVGGKTERVAAPKTRASIRQLSLPDALVETLRAHRENQHEERALLGAQWRDHDLVFASDVGTPISPRNLQRHFKLLLRKAGLPDTVRFHDLRHSCASMLIAQGVHLKVVSEILGHSSIQITADTYGHVAQETQRRAVEGMAQVLRAGGRTTNTEEGS